MSGPPSSPCSGPLSDFFLDSPEKLDDPFADLAWLREHHPVYKHEASGQWFVFPYDEVSSLFADRRLSADRIAAFAESAPPEVREDVASVVPFLETWLIFRDGPEHGRLRRALHEGFNATAIAALRAPVERVANALLDQAIHDGRLDVAADYGFLLPVYVLAEFMGVPVADHDRVVQWSVDFVDFFNVIPITSDTAQRMVRSSDEMARYMRGLLSARETHERNDFLGLMARAARTGEIGEQEAIGSTMLLLIAGHLPVRNLIGNVVWLLGRRPDDFARVLASRDMIDGVIEETLRYEPPIGAIPRTTIEDITVCGRRIPAGEVIQLSILAANRDPGHFPDPDRFEITRKPHGVLSFGHGPHGCLGARLAREQAQIALEVLFRRTGPLWPDGERETRWYRNAANRGPENLPVKFG